MSGFSFDIGSISVSARRRHVTLFLALDTSYSMRSSYRDNLWGKKKTRMEAAVSGACQVLDTMEESDHVSVLGFGGEEINNLSDGVLQMTTSNKQMLKRKVCNLTASGGTKLYDTIITGCKGVLSIAAALHQASGDSDAGTFWLVVLTDGEDTSSTSTLATTIQLVESINSELGSDIMKIALIGVCLEDGARSILQRIARAGGSVTKFVDTRNLKEVTDAFEEIAAQVHISRARVSIGSSAGDDDDDDDNVVWDGDIKKGSHVRCVGTSRGSVQSVKIGDVGVVKTRDSDGDYIVNFPRKDGWFGRPCDVVLDDTADKVRPGAIVAVKRSVFDPVCGWGGVDRSMHGMVIEVKHDGAVKVQFGLTPSEGPKVNLWTSILQELEVADPGNFQGGRKGPWPGKLQLGMAVEASTRNGGPSTGWGSLKSGEIGYVRGYRADKNLYVCDFPSVDSWMGREGDLVVNHVATLVRPQKLVRIRKGVEPAMGWAGVSRNSVGRVLSCSYDARVVTVKFPEHPSWKGSLSELETLDKPQSNPEPKKSYYQDTPVATPTSSTSSSDDIPFATAVTPDSSFDSAESKAGSTAGVSLGSLIVIKGLTSPAGAPLNGKLAEVLSITNGVYTVKVFAVSHKIIKVRSEKFDNANGRIATLQGITKDPSLNGGMGTITGHDQAKSRININIYGRMLSLPPEKLTILPEFEEMY